MHTLISTELTKYLPSLLKAGIILIVGYMLAVLLRATVRRSVKGKNNAMFLTFMANVIFAATLSVTLIIALTKLGVPTATLVTIMGAASLTIGLALKNFLANIAAGFMIVFLKPFKIGDSIVSGSDTGTVLDINLFMTRLKTVSNECLFIPNNKIINATIVNKSYYDTRRVDLTLGVDYGSDIQLVRTTIENVLKSHELVLQDPAFTIGVQNLADSAIEMLVRFWVERPNLVNAKLVILEALGNALVQEKINIPFPQMEITLKHSASSNTLSKQTEQPASSTIN